MDSAHVHDFAADPAAKAKTPQKKRVTRSIKPRSNVDPTRVALAALERIKTVLLKSNYKDRLGDALPMKELAAQSQLLGTELPPSYVAAMRVSSRIGEPDVFLLTSEMEAEYHSKSSLFLQRYRMSFELD